jgi:UDP-glucose 4-epimerase
LLIEKGHQVVVVDDLSTGKLSNINPEAVFYKIDIRDSGMQEVFEKENPDIVNHHAAQMDVRKSMSDPIFDADVNILGSIKLAQLSMEFNVSKFIFISSGGAIYGEPEYLPCDEYHPVRPLSPYGASKYAFEKYLFLFRENYGLNYSILRYPNVYGPRQDPLGEAGVVAIFTGKMLHNQPVTINGSGEQVRDFVYVKDCALANLLVMDKGDGSAYNLGSGIGISVNQIFTHLHRIINYQKDANYGPPKAGETFRIYLDATKANKELDWQPSVDLQVGLQNTVDFFRIKEGI